MRLCIPAHTQTLVSQPHRLPLHLTSTYGVLNTYLVRIILVWAAVDRAVEGPVFWQHREGERDSGMASCWQDQEKYQQAKF